MLALVIETSTERAIVAIVKDNACLYMAGLPFGFHNSKYLVPKIEEAFYEIQKSPYDLNSIVVGIGPGSYTGIRVGASVAKTLSYACKVPLIGIGTLDGFIPNQPCHFCAILDAKGSGFYVQKGIYHPDSTVTTKKSSICAAKDLPFFLKEIGVLLTPSVIKIKDKVDMCCPAPHWDWQETAPDPVQLARRAESKLDAGLYSMDGSLDILYVID